MEISSVWMHLPGNKIHRDTYVRCSMRMEDLRHCMNTAMEEAVCAVQDVSGEQLGQTVMIHVKDTKR